MPASGTTLPQEYFGGEEGNNVRLWITSLPPYYCQNNGTPGDDFSNDNVWVGVSMANTPNSNVPVRFTTGVKFAYTVHGSIGGDTPKITDPFGVGSLTSWTYLNNPLLSPYYQNGTADGNWGLQNNYNVGPNQYDFAFGPYELDKTTDGTPYPSADGDIIVVTTGSNVIGGFLQDGGTPYSAQDGRMFNLIFYSTGSDHVEELVASIPENNSPGLLTALASYNETSRYNFIANSGGLFAFVAIPNNVDPNQLMWWPISWNGSGVMGGTTTSLLSRNDS